MDLVLKLREARRMSGLTQREAAKRSGIHVKTISSFETGMRIGSMKLEQLFQLLLAYDMTVQQFFGGKLDEELEDMTKPLDMDVIKVVNRISDLPKTVKRNLASRFNDMIEAAELAIH